MVPKKAAKLEKVVRNLKKRPLTPQNSRPAYGGTKTFAYSRPQESWLQYRLG